MRASERWLRSRASRLCASPEPCRLCPTRGHCTCAQPRQHRHKMRQLRRRSSGQRRRRRPRLLPVRIGGARAMSAQIEGRLAMRRCQSLQGVFHSLQPTARRGTGRESPPAPRASCRAQMAQSLMPTRSSSPSTALSRPECISHCAVSPPDTPIVLSGLALYRHVYR